jgi:hypothetical protein
MARFPRLRCRFGIRVLLGLLLALAFVLAAARSVIDRYYEEQIALRQLSELRVTVNQRTEHPKWLRYFVSEDYARFFDRVVELDLSGRSVNDDKGYWQDPHNFTDEQIRLIVQFRELEKLNVANTSITALSIPQLDRLTDLQALFLNGSLNRSESMADFRKRNPACIICDGRMVTATIYADGGVEIENQRSTLDDVSPLLRKASLGPAAFGYGSRLEVYLLVDPLLVGDLRDDMIRRFKRSAMNSGYKTIQMAP